MGLVTSTLTLSPSDPPVKALEARQGRKGFACQNTGGTGAAWLRFGEPSRPLAGFKLVPSGYLDLGNHPPSDPVYLACDGASPVTVHIMEWF